MCSSAAGSPVLIAAMTSDALFGLERMTSTRPASTGSTDDVGAIAVSVLG